MLPQVRVTPDLFTVEIGVESSFSFDQSGCLVRALWDNQLSRWGLDGSCLWKPLRWPGAPQPRQRHLNVAEGLCRAAEGYERAAVLLKRLVEPPGPPWDAVLECTEEHGVRLMQSRAQHFARVYKPVGILPPDQYGALLLQLTEGCRYNRCRFCTFYRDRPYHQKTLEEFADHIEAVSLLVGEAMGRRRSVFLGDANALGLPFAKIHAAFELMQAKLPWGPGGIGGVYTFMDLFGKFHAPEEFAALRRMGLRRVYLGAESGSPRVLETLGKPSSPDRIEQVVQLLKEGGVGVGLIFLLGAGGDRLAQAHAQQTVELLSRLPLDAQDMVYLSELVVAPDSEYALWVQSEGVQGLREEAIRQQEREIRGGLRPVGQGGPACTRYDVREFIYY